MSKNFSRKIWIPLLVLGMFGVGAGSAVVSHFSHKLLSTCAFQAMQELPSPKQDRKAVLYVRACPTKLNTRIAVVDINAQLSPDFGVAFESESNVLLTNQGPSIVHGIRMQWVSPSKLRVYHRRDIRVLQSKPIIGVTSFDYRGY